MLNRDCSVRNLPQQSANAEAFAEAYLHFIVFASAIKMQRQLNSQKFKKKKSFPRTKKEIFCKRKKVFFHKTFFYKTQIIHVHLYSLFIPSFHIFLTHYSSALNRSSFPESLLCYALNEVIDVIHFLLSKQVFFLLKSSLN